MIVTFVTTILLLWIALGITVCCRLLSRHSGDVEERLMKLIEHTKPDE